MTLIWYHMTSLLGSCDGHASYHVTGMLVACDFNEGQVTYIHTHGGELLLQFSHELQLCGNVFKLGHSIHLVFVQLCP